MLVQDHAVECSRRGVPCVSLTRIFFIFFILDVNGVFWCTLEHCFKVNASAIKKTANKFEYLWSWRGADKLFFFLSKCILVNSE